MSGALDPRLCAAIALVVLELLDAASTLRVLRLGGRELNPLLRALFDRLGAPAGLVLGKGLILLALWLAWPLVPAGCLWVAVALYTALVVHNWMVACRLTSQPSSTEQHDDRD